MSEDRSEPEHPNLPAFRLLVADRIFSLVALAFKFAFWGWVAYQARLAIGELAGQETSISVIMQYLIGLKEGQEKMIYATVVLLLAAWGFLERKLRYRKTERLQERIRILEIRIDPARSTSGLTPEGRTNPRDR